MEEILASIRRIIADDEAKPAEATNVSPSAAAPKPAVARAAPTQPALAAPPAAKSPVAKPSETKPPASAAVAPLVAMNSQDEIDAMLAGLDADTSEAEIRPSPESDVFELTEQMTVPDSQPSSFQTIEPQNDIEFTEAPAPAPPPPPRAFEQRIRAQVVEEVTAQTFSRPLLSQSTASAVDSAFNSLAQTVLSNNARTLEDLVKEMLRPLLKGWLDDNLPGVVEKIVRAEIERVSRGR